MFAEIGKLRTPIIELKNRPGLYLELDLCPTLESVDAGRDLSERMQRVGPFATVKQDFPALTTVVVVYN